MARSRNIKPGFFLNDDLAECDPLARLLFAGLWCIADREGRLEDRPKRIKIEVLPYDNCDVDELLNQLAKQGFILRYEVGGNRYIQIVNFLKHQNPHYKESESIIPSPPGWIDSNYVAFGVPEELRQETFDRDGRKCVICGAKEDLSIDHIIPRSKGGTNDPENLQTLCRSCNSSKKNREAAAILKDKITISSISSANDRPMIGQSSVNDSPTFPADSLNLIPDSFNPHTDTKCMPEQSSDAPVEQSAKKPKKAKYADFVSLTNAEYEALVAKLGEDGAKRCIEILDNYKGAKGKKYKSDYRAILNWVVERYEEEKLKKQHNHRGHTIPQKNFEQREYGSEFYDRFLTIKRSRFEEV
jgi:hypothetical protein